MTDPLKNYPSRMWYPMPSSNLYYYIPKDNLVLPECLWYTGSGATQRKDAKSMVLYIEKNYKFNKTKLRKYYGSYHNLDLNEYTNKYDYPGQGNEPNLHKSLYKKALQIFIDHGEKYQEISDNKQQENDNNEDDDIAKPIPTTPARISRSIITTKSTKKKSEKRERILAEFEEKSQASIIDIKYNHNAIKLKIDRRGKNLGQLDYVILELEDGDFAVYHHVGQSVNWFKNIQKDFSDMKNGFEEMQTSIQTSMKKSRQSILRKFRVMKKSVSKTINKKSPRKLFSDLKLKQQQKKINQSIILLDNDIGLDASTIKQLVQKLCGLNDEIT
eukprot:24896_1